MIQPESRTRSLEYKLCRPETLTQHQQQRMLQLMQQTYYGITSQNFLHDLNRKHFVGILMSDGLIQGFTTYAINPDGFQNKDYDVLFSGDTIIQPEFRGTQELVRGFGHTIGSLLLKSQKSNKHLYWLLTTKGHRTYLYLPIFFARYYPACLPDRIANVADKLQAIASFLFKKHYDPRSGLVRNNPDASRLREAETQSASLREKKNKHVAYFLKRNPEYTQGHELACLTEISIDNMLRAGRRYVQEGLDNPIC